MAGSKSSERKIKVLFCRSEMDAHDRAPKLVIRKLMDAGMEVVYFVYGMPEEIVDSAIQEDVDAIGLSFYSGGQEYVVPTVMKMLRERKVTNMVVVVGGVIYPASIPVFKGAGVSDVFPVGTPIEKVIDHIRREVGKVPA